MILTAADKFASPWLVLPLCFAVIAVGVALATNFRGLAKRQYDWIADKSEKPDGFASSFDFQRMIGVAMALAAIYGVLRTVFRLWV